MGAPGDTGIADSMVIQQSGNIISESSAGLYCSCGTAQSLSGYTDGVTIQFSGGGGNLCDYTFKGTTINGNIMLGTYSSGTGAGPCYASSAGGTWTAIKQ